MKKLFLLFATAFICFACNVKKDALFIKVSNPLAMERTNEMIELDMNDISEKLKLGDTAQVVVLNAGKQQVPYQITYDDKLIFPVTVAAGDTAVYTIQVGIPDAVPVTTCGRQYPERLDDIAWENDLVAFRTYGPALQKTGERAFGYDVWTKYNTTEPVVEARYAGELNPETKAKIAELKKTDPKAASELYQSVSYHVDHGNGLDCYKVGPTLGGGTAALMPDGEIAYPYCYNTYEILDNGPLRFTMKLVYNPLFIKGDTTIIETRIISLDAGSHLNKAVVSYENLKEGMPIAAGIVLHDDGPMTGDATNGYIAYADPTEKPDNNNGKIYIGAAFPTTVKEAKVVLFPEEEKVRTRGGAEGHLLGITDYEPGSEYTYYWGSAWEKADIKTFEAWNAYMSTFAQKVRNPLQITTGHLSIDLKF